MKDKEASFIPGRLLHVYNRANGNDQLFVNDGNYEFFLYKYRQYFQDYVDTIVYCLMPNHFHFIIRIKESEHILELISKNEKVNRKMNLDSDMMISKKLSYQLSNFLNGYAQAFNKQESRKGSLFMHPTKRKIIDSQSYFIQLIHYIHRNPVEAQLCKTPEEWKYSSYNAVCSKSPSLIQRNEVISLFDDLINFKAVHSKASLLSF